MRKFKINVNGTEYDVEVEEITDSEASAAPAVTAAPVAPAAKAAPAPKAAPAKAPAVTGGTKICAPMPGSIVKINCKAGDTVAKGSVLCVLEAMKMENDILAPADGTVASVNVTKGASVNADDVVVILK